MVSFLVFVYIILEVTHFSDLHWLQEPNEFGSIHFKLVSFSGITLSFRRSRLALSLKVPTVVSSPAGCFWAPETRERQRGSGSGPSSRPGASAADLRGDESRGFPPPRRLLLPVTPCC